jgi:hypothetical protein
MPGGAEHILRAPADLALELGDGLSWLNHGEGIERQAPGHGEASDRRYAEKRRAEREHGGEATAQPILEEREKAAARAIAKQGAADRHIGEVVPLDDREEVDQQHLVGERAGGNQAGRSAGCSADGRLVVARDMRPQARLSSLA